MAGPVTRASDSDRSLVAGVDEAGRGPLAGPVVAAAVVLDQKIAIPGLRDSKRVSPAQRTRLARVIRQRALGFALGFATPAEIDELNILRASLLAMERAVLRLPVIPYHVRVDGNQTFNSLSGDLAFSVETVVRGDQLVAEISAASILAKVCRDRIMRRWHRAYPEYGFDRNKGYPTPGHMRALQQVGPSPIHRRTFAPVTRALERRIG
ncbi:MAG TPA: ribonuclease HII [Gammaproteobacteria bacterium]